MRWLPLLAAVLLLCFGCASEPLPFPTPGRGELVVLVQPGPLTQRTDEDGKLSGFEHDLIELFARELGVEVRYIVTRPEEIVTRLAGGEAHFAATWHTPVANTATTVAGFLATRDVLVQHEASLPIDEVAQLAGHRIHVAAGSRQAATLRTLTAQFPGIEVVEESDENPFGLIEAVGDLRMEMALVDSALLEVALQFVPAIQATLEIGDAQPVAWRFGDKPNPELLARANTFIERIRQDGTLARIEDRYLGHVQRLKSADIAKYLEKIETVLPKLRKLFVTAQNVSGIDWRLLAAVAYHESQWDAEATSPTNVRGIMMLTEETADRMGVTNRLDPKESILAGARYLDYLKSILPPAVKEPDRTWLALAAYNIGPGHFNAARTIATQVKADPDVWYEMKRVLPLLAQPKYYSRLKSGRARGGEAVILVENIRSYYDILRHHEPNDQALPLSGEMIGMAGGLGGESRSKAAKR